MLNSKTIILQELARKVQKELEMDEKDKMMAIEAQDRELAKIIYEKEKARLRRAKERARLKSEAAAMNKNSAQDDLGGTSSDTASELTPRRRSPSSTSPPRIPEKSTEEGFLGFKANPKKLPPNPQQLKPPSSSSFARTSRTRSDSEEPIPPYMPIHGFNISPKRPNNYH